MTDNMQRARELNERAAEALLSARSHIGACRPDDEDDAAWWDELTELAAALRLAVPEGMVLVPREPTAELMAAASIAVWPMASAADVEMAKRAADIVLRESMDLQPGATRDMLAASIATMAPAYRAMLAAAPYASA